MKQTIIITENPEQQGWNKNTELCMDVTTFLRSDSRMKAGKDYHGVLRRHVICEDVFHGEYITVTRRGDGTYHPNFRPIPTDKVFNLERYAAGVANELLWALEGLVEK